MIDPVLSLSVSVQSNKGVYALLLGSGVSRASGLPTAWEVVQDLIRRIALLKGENCEPDPAAWYRGCFGGEPNYSEVLSQIAGSSAERSQLLRSYFEPSEAEREQGDKQPTVAHHRIAELVNKGYIRVIVTTNFDRLMEQALSRIGVAATVIASADAVTGAMPLVHSPCTIIKVHGDYLDVRLKNTADELGEYDDRINGLLDKVFDEYGLIVCGWSGAWDPALRTALERCSSRRFTTYWTLFGGPPASEAASLISFRKACVLMIESADAFFRELSENVQALESFSISDPISGDVAVARLKRYLAADQHRIALHDLFLTETQRACAAVIGERFQVDPKPPYGVDGAAVLDRLRGYEDGLSTVLRLAAVAAYWARPEQGAILLSCLTEILAFPPWVSGLTIWISLRWYAPVLLFYAMGLAALANSNYHLLREILVHPVRRDPNRPAEPAAVALNDGRVLELGYQRELPARAREHTPLLNHLFEILRDSLRDLLLSPARYDDLFDEFEYVRSLTAWDASITRADIADLAAKKQALPYLGVPLGRYAWKESFRQDGGLRQRMAIKTGMAIPNRVAALLGTGLFESEGGVVLDKYLAAKDAIDNAADRFRWD